MLIIALVVSLLAAAQPIVAGGVLAASTHAPRRDARSAAGGAKRDIYHLVLDRYGSADALRTGFGLENASFVAWLRSQGFEVVDDAHANYARTTLSLGATLGMSLLDDIAAAAGPAGQDLAPVVRRIRTSAAGAFLRRRGYEYVYVGSWFTQTRHSENADRLYRPDETVPAFESELDELSSYPVPSDAPKGLPEFQRYHAAAARYQLDVLEDLRDDPGPKYVFAHILLPHPPYVFLEDGSFDPQAATLASQLAFTNRALKRFLGPLLRLPEAERPIVILQGDEGPYPTRLYDDELGFEWAAATAEEIVTKFGILDAWLLPGAAGRRPLPAGMTPVNTYPELFRRYFGAHIPFAADRIYASTKEEPFALSDITERLAAAERAVLGTDEPPLGSTRSCHRGTALAAGDGGDDGQGSPGSRTSRVHCPAW
jgi:hypothetical protein